jgi:hypothetical protein
MRGCIEESIIALRLLLNKCSHELDNVSGHLMHSELLYLSSFVLNVLMNVEIGKMHHSAKSGAGV